MRVMLVMLRIVGVLHDRFVLSVLVEDVAHGSLLNTTSGIHDCHTQLGHTLRLDGSAVFALPFPRCRPDPLLFGRLFRRQSHYVR